MSDLMILRCREQRDTSGHVPRQKSVFMNAHMSKCKGFSAICKIQSPRAIQKGWNISPRRSVFQSVLAERKRLEKNVMPKLVSTWSQLKLGCVRFFLETKVFCRPLPYWGCVSSFVGKTNQWNTRTSFPTSLVSKRSCSAGMTLAPGGDTVSYFIRSWRIPIGHDGTDEALEQRNINPSTRTGIFKCEGFTSFTRVENLHHTSFGSVQGLNNDIFCVSIRLKFLFVEAKPDFLARRTVHRFAAIDRKVAAFL